jgi:hypothetical protein
LLAAGQLKTNRQPIPECALYLQSIAAKGDSMDRDRTRDRLTSGATDETMAVSYGIIGGSCFSASRDICSIRGCERRHGY